MARNSYNDLSVVHRYLPEITRFIEGIVLKESVAIVIACRVFEEHKKKIAMQPFASEKDRALWLRIKARDMAIAHQQRERNDELQKKAIRKAIHDCP